MSSPNLGECPTPITNQTVTSIPSWIAGAYGRMNSSIAEEHARYGGTAQYPHLIASGAAISATARSALNRWRVGEERTAIILGPGGCFDIPLEEIVTEFGRTTLVDVDTAQTERALCDLPPQLLGKISLRRADISGRVAELSTIFNKAGEMNYLEFINVAAMAVNGLAKQSTHRAIEGSYSFTCSQLLMSQLSSIPVTRFSRRIEEVYGVPLSTESGKPDEPLSFALNEYNERTQAEHVRHLAELTSPNGVVHFADTVGMFMGGELLPMVGAAPFDEMAKRFSDLAPAASWEWQANPGRRFLVLAQSLVPKQSA